LDTLEEKCHAHHLKVTPQRVAVFKALQSLKKEHPSAEMVYCQVRKNSPHISFDTVNRTLLKFAEIGIVDAIKGVKGPRRFDPVRDGHHHFHCIRCGAVFDFENPEYDEFGLPENIEKKHRVLGKQVVLTGLCSRCLKNKQRIGVKASNKKLNKEKNHEQD